MIIKKSFTAKDCPKGCGCSSVDLKKAEEDFKKMELKKGFTPK